MSAPTWLLRLRERLDAAGAEGVVVVPAFTLDLLLASAERAARRHEDAVALVDAVPGGVIRALRQSVARGEMSREDAAAIIAHRALAGMEHPLRPALVAEAMRRMGQLEEGRQS